MLKKIPLLCIFFSLVIKASHPIEVTAVNLDKKEVRVEQLKSLGGKNSVNPLSAAATLFSTQEAFGIETGNNQIHEDKKKTSAASIPTEETDEAEKNGSIPSQNKKPTDASLRSRAQIRALLEGECTDEDIIAFEEDIEVLKNNEKFSAVDTKCCDCWICGCVLFSTHVINPSSGLSMRDNKRSVISEIK